MKHPSTLPQDILSLLDEDVDFIADESLLDEAAEQFKSVLRRRLSRQERSEGLRMSSIGKPGCQIWYNNNKADVGEKLTPTTHMKFLFGDMAEILLLFLAKSSGHVVEQEQAEVEVDGVLGHIDAVIDGVVVDVKSASGFAFQKFKEGRLADDDPFGYINQLCGYAHALDRKKEAGFLVINKENGAICYYDLDENTIAANPPAPVIAQQRENIAAEDVPRAFAPVPDGKSGNMKLPTNCSYCSFKHDCWRGSNNGRGLRTFLYSGGPRYLVHVEREPDVYETA